MQIPRDLLGKLFLSLGVHVLSVFNKCLFCSSDGGTDNPGQTSLGKKTKKPETFMEEQRGAKLLKSIHPVSLHSNAESGPRVTLTSAGRC